MLTYFPGMEIPTGKKLEYVGHLTLGFVWPCN